jgi:hypothetical protein
MCTFSQCLFKLLSLLNVFWPHSGTGQIKGDELLIAGIELINNDELAMGVEKKSSSDSGANMEIAGDSSIFTCKI